MLDALACTKTCICVRFASFFNLPTHPCIYFVVLHTLYMYMYIHGIIDVHVDVYMYNNVNVHVCTCVCESIGLP